MAFINVICLVQVLILTFLKKCRVQRLNYLLPSESNKQVIDKLADNLDHFFTIECNSNKPADKLRELKNSLINTDEEAGSISILKNLKSKYLDKNDPKNDVTNPTEIDELGAGNDAV